MIDTYYSTGQLDSPQAFFVALAVGLAFGFVLERAGFGSSRRLAGIFYFRDMTVLRVMFTAVITAMLGLLLFTGMGWIDLGSVYAMPTIFGAQVAGGLLFGVGFVIGGWCPGTAAVGAVTGKLDALVFLGGAIVGSILFNETFPWLGWLMDWGYQEEPLYAFGMSRAVFGLLFTLVAVAAFYFAEWVESLSGGGAYLRSPMLKGLAAALVVAAAALLVLPGEEAAGVAVGSQAAERACSPRLTREPTTSSPKTSPTGSSPASRDWWSSTSVRQKNTRPSTSAGRSARCFPNCPKCSPNGRTGARLCSIRRA